MAGLLGDHPDGGHLWGHLPGAGHPLRGAAVHHQRGGRAAKPAGELYPGPRLRLLPFHPLYPAGHFTAGAEPAGGGRGHRRAGGHHPPGVRHRPLPGPADRERPGRGARRPH